MSRHKRTVDEKERGSSSIRWVELSGPESRRAAREYHVRGFQTLIIVDQDGRSPRFQVGDSPTLSDEVVTVRARHHELE